MPAHKDPALIAKTQRLRNSGMTVAKVSKQVSKSITWVKRNTTGKESDKKHSRIKPEYIRCPKINPALMVFNNELERR